MRVSVEDGDRGEKFLSALRAWDKDVRIFLDGIEQRNVLTADDEEGLVRRFPGGLPHDGEKVLTEDVLGNVKIEIYSVRKRRRGK